MINRKSERALYRQLADILRDAILSGEYAPGSKLPTADALTRTYDVGHGVAAAAITLLKHEGLVETAKGKTPRVASPPPRDVVRIQRGSSWEVRPATADEREELELGESEWVVVVFYGAKTLKYPAARVKFHAS